MKIKEVEALAGIPKKNIRFYEEQGLLLPKRDSENGYRDYG
ncbi:MAG: MerR family transcriptional regulator, partial [Firmicutes bacterium]|nr:MerR family transcriptional regulator [Bacillota bacterium]